MELLIGFAAVVLYVFSKQWRKFVHIVGAVLAVSFTVFCLYVCHDDKPSRPSAQIDISDLPAPAADDFSDLPSPPKAKVRS